MGPPAYGGGTPFGGDFGVMVRGIRQFADAVCKRKGLGETRKRKAARQAVYTSDRPDCPARQLGRETRCLNPPSPSDCQAGTPRSFRAPNIPHRHGSPGRPCSRRTPAPVARPRCCIAMLRGFPCSMHFAVNVRHRRPACGTECLCVGYNIPWRVRRNIRVTAILSTPAAHRQT